MPFASLLDPSILDLEIIISALDDIEDLIKRKREKIKKEFEKWEEDNKESKRNNQEWYLWNVDGFVDEMFLTSELEANLLNGLAVTANTIFERHIRLFIRKLSSKNSKIKYKEKHTYKMDELKNFLAKTKHPNNKRIKRKLLKRLRIYTDIRNYIVHEEGHIPRNSVVRSFILENKNLFNWKNRQLWIVSVKGDYIRKVTKDIETLFKLLLYTKEGQIIY